MTRKSSPYDFDDTPTYVEAAAPTPTATIRHSGREKLFDITCVVGTVYSGGTANPRSVAFDMIAAHTEGMTTEATFSFPNEDGSINHVTVSTQPLDATH